MLQQHLAASGMRRANNNLCMRCGGRRHCFQAGREMVVATERQGNVGWGRVLTAKCSLWLGCSCCSCSCCLFTGYPAPPPGTPRPPAICIHTICRQKVNLSCAQPENGNCGKRSPPLHTAHHSSYPDLRHITCNRLHSRIYAWAAV